jgi:uncharacterized protein with GYD domain
MAYRGASKLTFTPAWADMSEEERQAEQVAAMEIVAKYGGEQEGQWVLWSDQVLFTITRYPDQESAIKSQMAIVARGAFELQSQTALTLDEMIGYQAEIAGD